MLGIRGELDEHLPPRPHRRRRPPSPRRRPPPHRRPPLRQQREPVSKGSEKRKGKSQLRARSEGDPAISSRKGGAMGGTRARSIQLPEHLDEEKTTQKALFLLRIGESASKSPLDPSVPPRSFSPPPHLSLTCLLPSPSTPSQTRIDLINSPRRPFPFPSHPQRQREPQWSRWEQRW